MKLLFLGDHKSIFVQSLAHQLFKSYDYSILVLDPYVGLIKDFGSQEVIIALPKPKERFIKNRIYKNFIYFKNFLVLISKLKHYHFEICHIHYLDVRLAFFIKFLKKNSTKIILTIYGSDIKTGRLQTLLRKIVISNIDGVTFSSSNTRQLFVKQMKQYNERKTYICRFGLDILDQIDEIAKNSSRKQLRNVWGVPNDKTVIVIGNNASPNSQHINILQNLILINQDFLSKIFVILPMTYGKNPLYISEVEKLLSSAPFKWIVLDSFLSPNKIAELRVLTDILIFLPSQDQLSGAFQEHLYAGSISISGSWLDYSDFEQAELFYFKIDQINQLSLILTNSFHNIPELPEKLKENRKKISQLSHWNNTIQQWKEMYISILKK